MPIYNKHINKVCYGWHDKMPWGKFKGEVIGDLLDDIDKNKTIRFYVEQNWLYLTSELMEEYFSDLWTHEEGKKFGVSESDSTYFYTQNEFSKYMEERFKR
jgi:hypothetical protein